MKEKALNVNLFLNSIRIGLSILFPLITFPYVTRILSPSQVGEYDYANSLINYFILIAGLGISTYAIRSGSSLREKKEEFEEFASEVFSVNVLSTIISYLMLCLCFILFSTFREFRISIILFSVSILFRTIGVEWVFGIYENYRYITIRGILFQILSLLLLFTLVKDEHDLYVYISITVLANVGSNICNFFYARRYCRLKIIINKKILKHIKPIMLIFSTTLATTVYINSDTTMLGLLCGNEQVGYYAVACKIYNCIKSLLNGLVPVFMARLSYQYKEHREQYNATFRYAFNLLTCITVPLAVGALLYSQDIILLLSRAEYLPAESAMKILFVSLIFATWGNLYSSGGLLQAEKESMMLIATTLGALINIGINYFLIPVLGCTGAAAATLATEVSVFLCLFYFFRKNVGTRVGCKHVLKCLLATIPFVIVKGGFAVIGWTGLPFQLTGIAICVILYFAGLVVLKDELLKDLKTESIR